MNLLTDSLPEAVRVGGVEYPITTDFRTCLRVILAFEDESLANLEKQSILLKLMFPERMPTDLEAACKVATKFLDGGQVPSEGEAAPRYRLYSWEKDGNLIYAAFRQTHGIDLEKDNLHWWKFLALYMDLGQDTTFCQLVSLRKRVKDGKATKEEKRAAREMGEMFDVPEPDNRTPEQKEAAETFMRMVLENEERRKHANQS